MFLFVIFVFSDHFFFFPSDSNTLQILPAAILVVEVCKHK